MQTTGRGCGSLLGCSVPALRIASRREQERLRVQASGSAEEVDVVLEMARHFGVARLIGVRFADNRIDQSRRQLTANSAIDGGQSEFECALDEQFFIDHSVEYPPPGRLIDRIATVPLDTR